MVALLAFGLLSPASHLAFNVQYPQTIMGGRYNGHLYVYVSKDPTSEPRLGPQWGNLAPVFIAEVKQLKPDTDFTLDDSTTTSTGAPISALPEGDYTVQAVLERNPTAANVGDGDGNLYSAPARIHVDGSLGPVTLICDQEAHDLTVESNDIIKVDLLESTLVSNAQRRSVVFRSVTVLPNEFKTQPNRKFPVIVDIPGYGETYADYPERGTNKAAYRDGKPFIYIRLDPIGATGYHAFADSATQGPLAKALVTEYLPYVEKEWHGDTSHVVLTGKGAGGWSALWLQANYPDTFSGAWATNPDSVDFHNFRGMDLYKEDNVLFLDDNTMRPWARGSKETWKEHSDVEKLLRGGPINAWDADFSPKAKNNKLIPLFDRATGRVDPVAAKGWQSFDLDAYLKANWATVGPKLTGKLHISGEDGDSEYRDASLMLLQTTLTELGANAEIQIAPAGSVTASQKFEKEVASTAYASG